jgi:hypothetical protein
MNDGVIAIATFLTTTVNETDEFRTAVDIWRT